MENIELREELDNYGDRLPIYIEDTSGRLYTVGEVYDRSLSDGVKIVLVLGEKVNQ